MRYNFEGQYKIPLHSWKSLGILILQFLKETYNELSSSFLFLQSCLLKYSSINHLIFFQPNVILELSFRIFSIVFSCNYFIKIFIILLYLHPYYKSTFFKQPTFFFFNVRAFVNFELVLQYVQENFSTFVIPVLLIYVLQLLFR